MTTRSINGQGVLAEEPAPGAGAVPEAAPAGAALQAPGEELPGVTLVVDGAELRRLGDELHAGRTGTKHRAFTGPPVEPELPASPAAVGKLPRVTATGTPIHIRFKSKTPDPKEV